MKKLTLIILSLVIAHLSFAIGPITGSTTYCEATGGTLSDTTTGGVWISSNASVATIGSTSGFLSGIGSGTAIITYSVSGTIFTTTTITVHPLPDPVGGVTNICIGTTTSLSDLSPGGQWSSSNSSVASVGTNTGIVTGVSLWGATITYKLPTGCFSTAPVTVYPYPSPIMVESPICVGTTSTGVIEEGTLGGTWSSSNPSVATVSFIYGVTGVSAGTAFVTYTLPSGCFVTGILTVTPTPAPITGRDTACTGSSTALADGIFGGVWTSSNTAIASINSSTGMLTALSAGTVIITYSVGGLCRTTKIEHVLPSPSAITLGFTGICQSYSATLSDITTGGIWTSGNTAVAIIGSSSGLLFAVSPGTSIISYKIGNGCIVSTTVNVDPTPMPITGMRNTCVGTTTILGDVSSGWFYGTWIINDTAIGLVGNSTGVLTGVSGGTASVTYVLYDGCFTTTFVTVNPTPAAITGATTLCAGIVTTLHDASSGGTWTSSYSSVAVVSSGGAVAGVGPGTAIISYSLATGCLTTTIVTINPMPAPISGPSGICDGTCATLSDVTISGVWSSSNTTAATIGTSSGLVCGVSQGTTIISYSFGGSCASIKTVTVLPSPWPPAGPSAICIGSSVTLSDYVPGGVWVSSSPSVATIGSLSGLVTGVSLGTMIITYTAPGGCFITDIFIVSPTPTAIGGGSVLCSVASITVTDLISGGEWSSGNTAVATVGSLDGVITGITSGTSKITYSLGSGCSVTKEIIVNPTPLPIMGSSSFCLGSPITLSDGSPGGTWSSSNTSVADIGSAMTIIGVSTGTTIITYTVATGCNVSKAITINPVPSSITGPTSMCVSTVIFLSDLSSGGTWTSSNTSVAIVGYSSGIVTALVWGTTIITYTLTTGCLATQVVTVNPTPGAIIGISHVCSGSFITYADATLGGEWGSNDTAVALAGSTGIVSGVSAGTSIITYSTGFNCFTTKTITVDRTPSAIEGTRIFCIGTSTVLSDSIGGGTWSSTGIAIIGSSSGVVTGLSSGTSIITYALPFGCMATSVITVNPEPLGITGSGLVCGSATFSDSVFGGVWSSSNIVVAAIGSATGIISAVLSGTAIVTYMLPTGCLVSKSITVNFLPIAGTISGVMHDCISDTTRLSDSVSGGIWISDNISIATVAATSGEVSGISAGTAIIFYIVTNSCGSDSASRIITINPLPSAGTIIGRDSVCPGDTATLMNTATSGTWNSSDTTIAAVTSTGVVTGIASGSDTVMYIVTNTCGSDTAVFLLTVRPSILCTTEAKIDPFAATYMIFPNPVHDELTIENAANNILVIFDVVGKEVYKTFISYNKETVNISHLPKGVYVVQIVDNANMNRVTKRVVKE